MDTIAIGVGIANGRPYEIIYRIRQWNRGNWCAPKRGLKAELYGARSFYWRQRVFVRSGRMLRETICKFYAVVVINCDVSYLWLGEEERESKTIALSTYSQLY